MLQISRSRVALKVCVRDSVRSLSSSAREPLVLKTKLNGVTTLTLNKAKKLNGWTQPMMKQMMAELEAAGTE